MGMFGFRGKPQSNPFATGSQFDIVSDSPANGGITGNMGLDASLSADPYAGQRPNNPGFFDKGGLGGKIGSVLGDVALFGPAAFAMRANRAREAEQGEVDFQRKLQIAQAGRQQEPTNLQRTREYLLSIGRPDLAETFTNAEASPMTLMTDPSTGAVGFYPKGGIPPKTPPAAPAIGTIEDGHQYIGGDPQAPGSWRKI